MKKNSGDSSLSLKNIKQMLNNNMLVLALCAVIVAICFIEPRFVQFKVIKDILTQASVKMIVALALLFPILVGATDLSAGRQIGLFAVIFASMMQERTYSLLFYPDLPRLPMIVPMLVVLVVAAFIGLINGIMVAKLKLPAFIATLGTSLTVFGICSVYFAMKPNNAQPIGGIRNEVLLISRTNLFNQINLLIIIAAVITAIIAFVLNRTVFGKNIFAVGGNQQAAKISGVNPVKIVILTYIIESCLICLAAILEVSRTNSATSQYGAAYEFDAISSCVVGGVSLSGGIGKIRGVLIGVIIFTVISYGLAFIGINPNWQQVIKGFIICISVAFDIKKNTTRL